MKPGGTDGGNVHRWLKVLRESGNFIMSYPRIYGCMTNLMGEEGRNRLKTGRREVVGGEE